MGYTDRLDKAMRDEPEAVSREVQAGLSLDANNRDRAYVRADLGSGRACIEAVLNHWTERYGRAVASEMKDMRRSMQSIERKLLA
jgi:hypothetical protein